ncbi:MAG: Rv3654c family TadE-like protein [Mycobacterium sp.]
MSERGSASIVAAAMLTVLVMMTAVGAAVGSALVARHRAQAAADLAALAAAGSVAAGRQTACDSASSVAEAMKATVAECTLEDLDVVVAVDVPISLGRWGIQVARGAARAGPAEGG